MRKEKLSTTSNPRQKGFPAEPKPLTTDKNMGEKRGLKLEPATSKTVQNEAGIVALAFRDRKHVYHTTNCDETTTIAAVPIKKGGYERKYSKLMQITARQETKVSRMLGLCSVNATRVNTEFWALCGVSIAQKWMLG